MIAIPIPGGETLRLEHLVTDYNGTLARDGALLPGVAEALTLLSATLTVHVVTADTFGSVRQALTDVPCRLAVLPPGAQDQAKQAYCAALGVQGCVCIGNGRNDRLMLKAAALGMAVVQGEGAAVETLFAADLVAPDILTALGLLLNPERLTATLRV